MNNKNFQTEEITNHIVNWLKDYAITAKVQGYVIGISGGIDSAVTSTLCAMTGLPLVCVEMPIHQEASQVNRGKEHIAFLKRKFTNVQSIEADLTQTFDTLQTTLPTTTDQALLNLTLANTRARLRMLTLYYFAGIHRSLVAGTGNKVEDFGVGFFTKYGDGGVDVSPIADLMKSEVRLIGEYLEIPVSIIKAKPTDGLFGDDRSDEDQLGASYDELEIAMIAHENGATVEEFTGRTREVFEIYNKLNRINQHKIKPIPVCKIPKNLKHR
ncbi:NAD(+) synthase [Myroides pelagicus]|uniref:NH(3)-dependent NAD(+) synthetase n=1 Tax=Myroides pelagicus TaxID=270914 RepID=A0A7K1GTS1_9FLAO|nr:NAD(+) synthase [Myroides pelagicus]MEC4112673.1 NAD(+) synthase [Myroides pelagicus]MTH31064.1 NAD(+) synthase [Myroides pelagicus]